MSPALLTALAFASLAAAILVFVLVAWLAFLWGDSNRQHQGLRITTEADPLESYPGVLKIVNGQCVIETTTASTAPNSSRALGRKALIEART